MAARAYNAVQHYLRELRNQRKLSKDTPKEELTAVFSEARRVAEEAVQGLRKDLNMPYEEGYAGIDFKMHDQFMDISKLPISDFETFDAASIQSSPSQPASIDIPPTTVCGATQLNQSPIERTLFISMGVQPNDTVQDKINQSNADVTTQNTATSTSSADNISITPSILNN
jgi:hypothetical protein